MTLVNGSMTQAITIPIVVFVSLLFVTFYHSWLKGAINLNDPMANRYWWVSSIMLCVWITLLVFLLIYFIPETNGVLVSQYGAVDDVPNPSTSSGAPIITGTTTGTNST